MTLTNALLLVIIKDEGGAFDDLDLRLSPLPSW